MQARYSFGGSLGPQHQKEYSSPQRQETQCKQGVPSWGWGKNVAPTGEIFANSRL